MQQTFQVALEKFDIGMPTLAAWLPFRILGAQIVRFNIARAQLWSPQPRLSLIPYITKAALTPVTQSRCRIRVDEQVS